ncbi:MAG: alpha/beta fold hydrolase [Bacteroides sp.]|nr:alpha/beta fold hydrolase [Bacteroides sp.]
MRIKSKYLWILGLLPGATATSFAQEQAEQMAQVVPLAYNKEVMTEREVVVGADGFQLPGTLTLPLSASAANKVPCVVLVHGSGPNDRDETLGPNKPFRDLAWLLAEKGVATIRYDKRTKVYGGRYIPEGREPDYDVEAVDDAVTIVEQVATYPEIDAERIYLLGHSLGGTLAPRIAQRSGRLAGVILLAGAARPLEDLLIEQVEYINSLSPSKEVEAQIEILKRQAANVKKLGSYGYDESLPPLMNLPLSYWKFANAYKPLEVVATLNIPILVMQGERDYQVTTTDLSLWQMALMFNAKARFQSYPALNHLFMEGEGKATPQEYNRPGRMPSCVADDIVKFIHQEQ